MNICRRHPENRGNVLRKRYDTRVLGSSIVEAYSHASALAPSLFEQRQYVLGFRDTERHAGLNDIAM